MAEIDKLEGWLNEPYRKNAVIAACRALGRPFLLREAVDATQLPATMVHRVLWRLWRQGVVRRQKVSITYPRFEKNRRVWEPGRKVRRVYLYSFVVPE